MRCGRTFRLARTHPAHARSSGSETLLRSRSLADYTIDMHESEVFGSHTSKNSRNNIGFSNTSSPVGREHRALTHRLTFLAERLVPWMRKVRQSPPARAGVGGN